MDETSPTHKIRASSLGIGFHCPGAPWLLLEMEEIRGELHREEDAPMRWGSIAHEYLAIWCNRHNAVAAPWLEDGLGAGHEFVAEMRRVTDWLEEVGIADQILRQAGFVERRQRVEFQSLDAYISCRLDWYGLSFTDGLTVIDWKWGHGQRWFLPDIEADLQMMAYAQAVGYGAEGNAPAGRVTVQRVLITSEEVHELTLDREQLVEDRETLGLIVKDIIDRRNVRITGTHCEHCLARVICPERVSVAHEVVALVPQHPAILALTDEQARRYALARNALRERLSRLDEALTRYVEAGGVVRSNGETLKVSSYGVDKVVNHSDILGELAVMFGGPAHIAMRTSKDAIGEALKAIGKKGELPKLLKKWRERGWVRKEQRKALRWRKDRRRDGPV